jgi:hypothetical protein
MISRYHQAAPRRTKPAYGFALLRNETLAFVNREQPEFVEIAAIEPRQYRVRHSIRLSVAGDDLEHRLSVHMPLLSK